MSQIDYKVPGLVRMVAQPDSKSCWAAAATIMMSWRYQSSFDILTALDRVGSVWANLYLSQSTGLDPVLLATFVEACGMTHERLQCYSPDGWLEVLELYGPAAIVTQPFTYHVRILWGMYGNLDPVGNNLTFRIADPEGGRWGHEPFRIFTRKVEQASRIPMAQVWHWRNRR
jgi:hypothetical protein